MTKGRRWRRDWPLGVAILVLSLLIIAKLENQQAQRFDGPFLAIDGDTLVVDRKRLRIDGIDAPELAQDCSAPDGSPYDCGLHAKRVLSRLMAEGRWECSGTARDRYDRWIVICRRGQDDLGALLVASGTVVADGRYLAGEAEARMAGEGLWSGEFERPSDWRRLRKVEEVEPGEWLETLLPRWLSTFFEE